MFILPDHLSILTEFVKDNSNECIRKLDDSSLNWTTIHAEGLIIEAGSIGAMNDGIFINSVEDLMLYHSAPVKIDAQAVFSQNAPMDHEMSDTAKKQYNLLLDVIDLCAIYY